MSVTYEALLERVVADGIEACRRDYADDADKLEGSIAGFEACRGRTPEQLAALLVEARAETQAAYRSSPDPEPTRYWYWRCRELEIEWCCNVVSACLANEGLPIIVPPTARGAMKAAEIVGVADA